jgi:hypothetical protein
MCDLNGDVAWADGYMDLEFRRAVRTRDMDQGVTSRWAIIEPREVNGITYEVREVQKEDQRKPLY